MDIGIFLPFSCSPQGYPSRGAPGNAERYRLTLLYLQPVRRLLSGMNFELDRLPRVDPQPIGIELGEGLYLDGDLTGPGRNGVQPELVLSLIQ